MLRARAADADREEVQAETELQERALDGIGAALGDMHRLTRVRVPCHGSNEASRILLCTSPCLSKQCTAVGSIYTCA